MCRRGLTSPPVLQREPEREEQPDDNMPPKFKRHLNDEEVTGSFRSERRNLLEEESDEEEDFFLRGPTAPRFGPQNDKVKQVQSQVDEVIDVMQENISKVIERGERLEDLQDKSGDPGGEAPSHMYITYSITQDDNMECNHGVRHFDKNLF
ncbi:hypothetical protein NHX12_033869 [Muraenolepis orangiensis]|uniref:V-SNARE coiled-coil homology domain-containing protein n=1 Tax=Muraenolepis orangiensis TaxID=630683 RepID=A0A9Q0E6T9_9TELE|nr:hypothetical protein NHX12_033869 [Muraenolepis orangiensis]